MGLYSVRPSDVFEWNGLIRDKYNRREIEMHCVCEQCKDSTHYAPVHSYNVACVPCSESKDCRKLSNLCVCMCVCVGGG